MDRETQLQLYRNFIENCTTVAKSVRNYSDFKRIDECISSLLPEKSILDFDESIGFENIISRLKKLPLFVEYDKKGNKQYSNTLEYYLRFLRAKKMFSENQLLLQKNNNKIDNPYLQQIFYGAPGTGKSHTINEITEQQPKENVFRTTFHPDSDYSTFVGCYKPTMISKEPLYKVKELINKLSEIKTSGVTYPCHKFAAKYWESLKDLSADEVKKILTACGFTESMAVETGKGIAIGEDFAKKTDNRNIVYSFVPQAFTKAYLRAWQTTEPVYLIIEEINRGNCAQIFGDLFQLLDRKCDGFSEYPIKADNDLAAYLAEKLSDSPRTNIPELVKSGEELVLPSNLYIWATMNTSDQSLFPIDSAFKRRWDWEYEPIKYKNIDWVIDIKGEKFSWVSFQREINKRIFAANSSEDKMLGDYFVNPYDGIITEKILLNKILFYLWNDVCKDGEGDIFKISETEDVSFSDLHGEGGAEKLIMMMEYLGISGLYDEENGDMTSIGNNQRKRPKYSVNGSSEQFSTPKAVQYIIENYAKQNEHISAEEMIGLWNEISERKNCLIASWSPSPNDNQPFAEKRRVEIKWGNKSAWLITGWTEELFQVFIHNVKAKLGIVIEKVE